jgi:ABC transport system ATP-binding/permease protein
MLSYLQTDNVSRRIGDKLLFSSVTVNINRNDKVALVGVNGSGKTSLLDIISGKESPDEGSVNMRRDIRISYLEQNPGLNDDHTIIDELFNSTNRLSDTVREYEKALISGDNAHIGKMIQRMDDLKAWDYEVSVKQVLFRLNLTRLDAKIGNLSGGERKRVALAKALVEESDLLIMDEPTNHLDLKMIEWMEDYLAESSKTIIMVTHDRYFLDRVCSVILELEDRTVTRFDGNYSYYVTRKQENETASRSSAERAKNLFRKELDWMRRMPKARTHKSKSRIDSFYDLQDKTALKHGEKSVSIDVGSARMGKKIIELHDVSKAFGDRTVIKNFTYLFSRYEKAGLVGENGSGKTTLLNIIAGLVPPDTGKVDKGETVRIGYYRQEGIRFDDSKTVIEAASEITESVTMSDGSASSVSQFLNYFLFPPERQRTLIRKLSGGEKRRLYLLTVLMQNPNFLLMDEPTNDLDIVTLNILEEYLYGFKGCVLIASHDRYFMDKIAGHIFEYRGDGVIKDFPGNYTELRNSEPADSLREDKKPSAKVSEPRPKAEKIRTGLSFREKREFEQLEAELRTAEEERAALELVISGGRLNQEELHEKSRQLGDLLESIDEKELRWLELSEKQSN